MKKKKMLILVVVVVLLVVFWFFGRGVAKLKKGMGSFFSSVVTDMDGQTAEQPAEQPNWADTDMRVDAPKNMTREEIDEKYFKPMEEIMRKYEESTDPDEFEKLAQMYNKLAVEGVFAYINTTGKEPSECQFIPRGEYLMKAAYYRYVKDQISGEGIMYDYDGIGYTYTVEGYDENDNPLKTNIEIYAEDDELISLNPEATDSIVYLYKKDEDGYINNFVILKDGGKSVCEIVVSDYTDKKIKNIEMVGDYVLLTKPKGGNDRLYYKLVGNKLVFEKETYDYESYELINNGYANHEFYLRNRDIEHEYFREVESLSYGLGRYWWTHHKHASQND